MGSDSTAVDRAGFARRMRELCEARGVTRHDLRTALDVPEGNRTMVHGWFSGSKIPSLNRMLVLARVLGTSLDYLLTGEEVAGYQGAYEAGWRDGIVHAQHILHDHRLPPE